MILNMVRDIITKFQRSTSKRGSSDLMYHYTMYKSHMSLVKEKEHIGWWDNQIGLITGVISDKMGAKS